MSKTILQISQLSVHAGKHCLLDGIDLEIPSGGVFGMIGPSGAGKSTLLKSLNRLTELSPNLKVSGQVYFQGDPIYARHVDADAIRARMGILFQQPLVFPKSIFANVIFGIRYLGKHRRKEWTAIAERALREAALWDEVKDRLKSSALRLSVGQQQRLCLARAMAAQPEVLLMDEPTSALDPKSSEAIESLICRLKETHTIVLVTHNLGQAKRVCDRLAVVKRSDDRGRIVMCGSVDEVLSHESMND